MVKFLGLTFTDKFCEGVIEACSFEKLKEEEDRQKKEGPDPGFWRKG